MADATKVNKHIAVATPLTGPAVAKVTMYIAMNLLESTEPPPRRVQVNVRIGRT
jgi:hypothetical protein